MWRNALVLVAACGGTSATPDATARDATPDAARDATPDAAPDAAPKPAQLAVSEDAPSFGDVPIGATSAPIHVDIANTGGSRSGPIEVTPVGGATLTVTPATCAPLDSGAHCTVAVKWTPVVSGPLLGTVTASAMPGGTASVTIAGSSSGSASLAIGPSTHDFGAATASCPPDPTTTFTVTNTGTAASTTLTTSTPVTGPSSSCRTGASGRAFLQAGRAPSTWRSRG